MARKLSVVTDETPPAKPTTIKAAAEMSERQLLAAMRTRVATEIDAGVPAHALAPLMRQLRELDKEIRAIDSRAGGDDIGEAASTPDADFRPEAL